MSTNLTHGMDLAEVEDLGRFLRREGDRLQAIAGEVDRVVNTIMWGGDDSAQFVHSWPTARARLLAMAEQIRGLGQSALNNASEQREASGGVGLGSSSKPHVTSRRIYHVSSDAAFVLLGAESSSTVTVEQLSDGTYAVIFAGVIAGDLGVSLRKLTRTLGIRVPADVGLDVGGAGGFSVAFNARDAESAQRLADALSGRASSITNRSILGGGVSPDEVGSLEALNDPDLRVESWSTRSGFGTDGAMSVGPAGLNAAVDAHVETTYHSDGRRTVTHIYDLEAGGNGWNHDTVAEQYTVSSSYRANGDVESVVVSRTETALADVRGGGEKLRDTALGFLPGVDFENSELQATSTVTTSTYDASNLTDADIAAARDGEYGRFVDHVDARSGSTVVETFSGSSEGATRGVLGGSSTTEHGESRLTSRSTR